MKNLLSNLTLLMQEATCVTQIYLMHEVEMHLSSTLLKHFVSSLIYHPKMSLVQYTTVNKLKKIITSKTLVKQFFLEISVNKKFSFKHTCVI